MAVVWLVLCLMKRLLILDLGVEGSAEEEDGLQKFLKEVKT